MTSNVWAISSALLEHAGIDPRRVTSVRYEHEALGVPTLTVECIVFGDDGKPLVIDGDIAFESKRFEWREVDA